MKVRRSLIVSEDFAGTSTRGPAGPATNATDRSLSSTTLAREDETSSDAPLVSAGAGTDAGISARLCSSFGAAGALGRGVVGRARPDVGTAGFGAFFTGRGGT